MLGRVNRPTRWRYVITESEFADHQISLSAALRSSDDATLSNVRCWPAKLASAPSSSTADERTASGPGSDRTDLVTCLSARSSPHATASTTEPHSATPGGTGNPARMASPSPTAFAPKSDSSRAFSSGTTGFIRGPGPHRRRRRPAPLRRRECDQSRLAFRPRRGCRTHAPRSPSATAVRRCRSRSRRAAAAGC